MTALNTRDLNSLALASGADPGISGGGDDMDDKK
jgi:hypothetical protein